MPIELSAAASQASNAEGYLSLLRQFVVELESPEHWRGIYRGLIAPEVNPASFDAMMSRAEGREQRCRATLARGEYVAKEFRRIGKGGREVWIQASYNPILDDRGRPVKVVKFATDVTEAKLRNAEFEGKVEAISRAQAVIEFDLDGKVITANENFLAIFGYGLDEIVGKHHRLFCEPGHAESQEYAEFWQKLGRGEYDAGEFKRIGKDGSEIWLQASYNPIFDASGKPFMIVKFASDISEDVQKRSLALLEMSTPVTKIWDGVLFAPIVALSIPSVPSTSWTRLFPASRIPARARSCSTSAVSRWSIPQSRIT